MGRKKGLRSIFDAVQRRLAGQTEEEFMEASADANQQKLQEIVTKELGQILDVLQSLPERDGRKFDVSRQEQTWNRTAAAGCQIDIIYSAGDETLANDGTAKSAISVGMTRTRDGSIKIDITRHFKLRYTELYDHDIPENVYTEDFDTVRKELGIGFTIFAPERIGDICEKLGADAKTLPFPQGTDTSNKFSVFRPLRLQGKPRIAV
ncbi:MAG: hypothetical protein ACAH83_08420 [Alphaproteobacteria bacterium]